MTNDKFNHIPIFLDALLLTGIVTFLTVYFDIRYLFYDTVVTGGDTASWYGVAHHLAKVLLPNGRLTGWDMGNFCGYPNFSFYFLPPFLLAVLPSTLFGIPLTITLKWAIMSGIFLFPIATYFGLRAMCYRFPVPIMGAGGAVVLLFNESYTMFGGNTLSTFAGEFCYMFAFAIFAYFIGSFYQGYKTDSRAMINGILLGLIGLSHLFIFIPALILLVYAFFDKARVRYLLAVGLTTFACMAFWILPLIAFRHPYTTPVYMIWQEFVNLRYTMAGFLVVIVFIGPRFALFLMGQGEKVKDRWRWFFVVLSSVAAFAVAYLLGQNLVLGKDLWYTGLDFPDFTAFPLGKELAEKLDMWVLPTATAFGMAIGALGLLTRSLGSASFTRFSRVVGSLCFSGFLLFSILGLHTVIDHAVPEADLKGRLLSGWTLVFLYGPVILSGCAVLIFSRRFGVVLSEVARYLHSNRFFMWLALVFGCVVAYFSAHFLRVPDIRFLPPLVYALFLIFCAETLGPFVIKKSMATRTAIAVTACYLAIIIVIFGASKSDTWYRFNNRGYELTSGFHEFEEVNRYLKTVYENRGLDSLNAPRVGYEKCDMYGRYGGDRVFESLPFFSGRQTLEGIHYAGSIASRCVAFLQTEFSKDIKTPKPQILSKINPSALPAHFDLYNISQIVVMTDKARKALSTSSMFEKEAAFGDITVYRYKGCNGRYVDVPKIRPVLYTGEKWVDDFFEWYKCPNRADILLVPDRYVKDENDRAAFSNKTDSFTDLDQFRLQTLDINGLKIDTHLEHLQIRFTTNRPGLPHLVKVSYFPNWKVQGANGVYPVSPHLMLVIPREKEVVLTYERSTWEVLGLWITCGWILFLIGKGALRFTGVLSKPNHKRVTFLCRNDMVGAVLTAMVRRFADKSAPTKNGKRLHSNHYKWENIWEPVERIVGRSRPLIFVFVIITSLCLIAAGTICRNRPVRTYVSGYREYKQGIILSREGKDRHAAKHFEKAIQTMKPLLCTRSRYDHRDVINSLLFTAMCFENLGEYEKAEAWYWTLLKEYPYSRYVGEGYVKIARLYKRRTESLWKDGLNKLRQGRDLSGKKLLKDGLALMEKSLQYYHQAIQNDPYSVWADYAVKDLEKENKFLDKTKEDLLPLCRDPEVRRLVEALKIRL